MILGIDHVAFSCADPAAGAEGLRREGYAIRFCEPDLPNPEPKRGLLDRFTPRHGLTYASRTGEPAIELTAHAPPAPDRPPTFYELLLPPAGGDPGPGSDGEGWGTVWAAALGNPPPCRRRCEPFGASVWRGGTSPAVGVPACRLDASTRFWTEGLGCTREGEGSLVGGGWIRIRRPAPVPAWETTFVLAALPGELPLPRLDDPGSPCVAFLSTDTVADLGRLERLGGTASTGPFPFHVGGRDLVVGMLRGPSGEIVELIEVQRS